MIRWSPSWGFPCDGKEEIIQPVILDVGAMIPRERHSSIVAAFENLKSGEAFILVNDHDPKPLYYQFSAERAGSFRWTYLEKGPEVWRVEIAKT